MPSKLQLTINPDVTGDGKPDIKITPGSLKLSDETARLIAADIAAADFFDSHPGDGGLDIDGEGKLPRLRLGFITIGGNTIHINAELRVVEYEE